MHTGKQKQMNASYQASLVNRHIRRFTGIGGFGPFETLGDPFTQGLPRPSPLHLWNHFSSPVKNNTTHSKKRKS